MTLKHYAATGRLLEKYGALLTFHQKQVMEQYYFYDLTMAEIASEQNISRSAVSEIIRLSNEKLLEFEEKLGLLDLEKKVLALIESLKIAPDSEQAHIIKRIKDILTHGI